VGALAGRHEPDHPRPNGIDHPDAPGNHIGNIEDAAVGGQLDVLRRRTRAQLQHAAHPLSRDVHQNQLAAELAARQQRMAVGAEVQVVDTQAGHTQAMAQVHRVGIAKVQPA
jgi:hypothetical protein